METTHKLKVPTRVAAWRYLKTSAIPAWVARDFHDLGNGKLSHAQGYVVSEGDWIVNTGAKVAIVLTNEEFVKLFAPNEESKAPSPHQDTPVEMVVRLLDLIL